MLAFLEDNYKAVLAVLCVIIALQVLVKIIISVAVKGHTVHSGAAAYAEQCAANGGVLSVLLNAKSGIPVYVSQNAKAITGIGEDSIFTDVRVLDSLFSREEMRCVKNSIDSWDKQTPIAFDAVYTHKLSGAECWGHVCLTKTTDDKYILLQLENREDVREKENELKKQLKEAQMVDESKTIFLSKMSHEIRTPMNGMLGMISLAKISTAEGKNAEAADYLNRAESLSQFLLSIINDILDMTRIESGKLELEKAPFSISDMTEKIRAMFETTITENGVDFVIDSDDFGKTTVLGDELRITQIISNLLSNSSKFTPKGGKITLTMRSMEQRKDKLALMIRVKDTGKGMSREFLHRLFRPFEQEDAGIARKYGGSGLGMSISDSLVHLMGGQILVDSEEGKGTEFTVFIELDIAKEVAKSNTCADTQQIDLTGKRLLMADDNAINTVVAVRLLQHRGFIVDTAVNGIECMSKFTQHEPGYYFAILMDIHMPQMDGWEATKKIRALDRPDGATIPIFALSADAFVEDRRHSVAVGMNGHISKPIDYEELEQALKACT